MSKYLVNLYPHQNFFFNDESLRELGNKSNYFKKSMRFPQQTTLLGLMRKTLLISEGIIGPYNHFIPPIKMSEANKLIGNSSFMATPKQTFGVIEKLEPAFLSINSKRYNLFNKSYVYENDFNAKEEIKALDLNGMPTKLEISGTNKFEMPLAKNYVNKKGFVEYLIDSTGTTIKADDLFYEHLQAGISKNYTGEVRDEAYYVNIYQGFNRKYHACFSFYLYLRDDFNWAQLKYPCVKLGTDKSLFFMEIVASPNHQFVEHSKCFSQDDTSDYLLCLSDVFVEQTIKIGDFLEFVWSDEIQFNNLRNQKRLNNISNANLSIDNSRAAFSRGSILLCKTEKKENSLIT
ncbi:MAG: hypothetical protein IPL31_17515 [Saprospiraceae bacterium]|nr:hypothetical protein [Saprospiraceae bacterium]